MNVVALAGGVGGAKLVDGLAQLLPPGNLTIIVNTGDDLEHFGLYICPDLDTVCYTLAGLANPETGWGRLGETFSYSYDSSSYLSHHGMQSQSGQSETRHAQSSICQHCC